MIIVNADDWGRTVAETDAALACHRRRLITSASAMVCMADSVRAAGLALQHGVDVGLHLNFSEPFAPGSTSAAVADCQQRICRFINAHRFAQVLYNPFLRSAFAASYGVQVDEFERLYGRPPSHVDGHHHKHLCSNVLLDRLIPAGQRVRRNLSFRPGEKGRLNLAYRRATDRLVSRRYRTTDYCLGLGGCLEGDRLRLVAEWASRGSVELIVHAADARQIQLLGSDRCCALLGPLHCSTSAAL